MAKETEDPQVTADAETHRATVEAELEQFGGSEAVAALADHDEGVAAESEG